ncbi:SseB family protein [Granulicoccus phenolivorans]|uniref:SseB family protein n=1 Tax=Granulicoccus phenolivorans TaxID=266854 RepID=UPI000407BAA9|nr:SseB family protein [Granulicoccus phenolivorans]
MAELPQHLRSLGGYAEYSDDDGTADPQVRRALAAADGPAQGPYLEAIVELCLSRLLMALMATGDETMTPDPTRHAEMRTVFLKRADGSMALPAFTGMDAMTQWNPRARPVPATLDKIAEAALADGADTVVIDLVGPHPLVIRGEILQNLALSRRLTRLPDGGFGWLVAGPEPGPGSQTE